MNDKVTVPAVRARKGGAKLAMVTAYDATLARLLEAGGAEILLVGDSLGMVVQGLSTTLPVTVDEICYHARAVARGAHRALIVGDLPFLSYQGSPEQALLNAGRLLKEGSCEAVKLEGGAELAESVRRMTRAGIPVMGHVGLLPQSVHAMGGFKVQGRTAESAQRVLADARALEEAGAFSIVLEGVPAELARRVTDALSIPTIGIGAGPHCDGQVLVCYDLLGLYSEVVPRFVKQFAKLGPAVVEATRAYVDELRAGAFPGAEHSFGMAPPPPAPEPTGAAAVNAPSAPAYGPADDGPRASTDKP